MEENDIYAALQELYRREGTQKRLAELAGITQSTINAYLSGKAKVENMPLGVTIAHTWKRFMPIRTLSCVTRSANMTPTQKSVRKALFPANWNSPWGRWNSGGPTPS